MQKLLSLFAVVLCHCAHAGNSPGELLFSDDFERAQLGADWRIGIPTFAIEKGALKGSQTREDHGAVGGIKLTKPDVVVGFKFRLDGSKSFNAVFDDKGFKGSHAGHICRVAITPRQIRLGDDKEGVMRNDIFEMRKDPARKAEADKLLMGRGAAFPVTIDQARWYRLRIEIVKDELSVTLDGKLVGKLKSPGIAHPSKNSFHFTVTGQDAFFDEVRVWAVSAAQMSNR